MAFTPIDPNKAEVRITGTAPNYGLDFYIPRGERGEIGPQGPVGPISPTNLTVGVVETGPETAGATGPTGAKGDKGDAGGFVASTVLAAGVNMNDVTAAGDYRVVSANATLALNFPKDNVGFFIRVVNAGTTLLEQIAYPIPAQNLKGFFVRSLVSGVWSEWIYFSSLRTDNTAGRAMYAWNDTTNGSQLIYGDTGVRRIETDFKNGWTAAIASLRRVGNVVQMGLYTVNPSAQTNVAAYSIPAGFKPGSYGGNLSFPVRSVAASGIGWTIVTGTGDVQPETTQITSNGSINVLTWTTGDAWPTVLPGTASGSIPSL